MLTSKLIDGTFPDYDRVIPFGNDKTLAVNRTEFVKAVDLVSTISTESHTDRGGLPLPPDSPPTTTGLRRTPMAHRSTAVGQPKAGH